MMATVLFVIGMSIYYLWRMFAITPQYDELYTYYHFISRGPLHAALSWPSSNNHVGYSLLSSIVDLCGNPFIGLRGVSYIGAISNLILLNRICRRYYSHWIPFGATLLYASMQVVNEYSVQGRGFTLATSCFLISVYIAGIICSAEETKPVYYVWLCFALALGMYTVPASIYWIVPMCIAISLYLLINAYRNRRVYSERANNFYLKKFDKFIKNLFPPALITLVLYGFIWLNEGSRMLIENEYSPFYNLSRGTVLVRAPVTSILTGFRFMRDHPYVRSVDPDVFNRMFVGWLFGLCDYIFPGLGVFVYIVMIGSLIAVFVECIRHPGYSRIVINLVLICNVFITPLMLILTHKLPYLKVFGYSAFVFTLSFATFIEMAVNVGIRIYNRRKLKQDKKTAKALHRENETVYKDDRWFSGIGIYTPILICLVFFGYRVLSSDFSAQLGERENDLFNTMYIANVDKRNNIAALDCDQRYLLKFGWDIDCKKTDVQDADCVIIDKDMLEPGKSGVNTWKFYADYDTIDWNYVDRMHPIYENENFILYVK